MMVIMNLKFIGASKSKTLKIRYSSAQLTIYYKYKYKKMGKKEFLIKNILANRLPEREY
jgi:hypothetical protein